MDKIKLERIYRGLVALIIFFIPSNLFLKFFAASAFVHGLFVDYLIPKLYVSDLLIIAIIALWGIEVINTKKSFRLTNIKHNRWLFIVGVLLAGRQLFTHYHLAAVWYGIKLIEIWLLSQWFLYHRSLLTKSLLSLSLAITVCFQSIIALYQYITQHSVMGYLFLGEAQLNRWAGIAKISFNGVEKVLPYGTTAHPNILAGFLLIYLVLIVLLKVKSWWSYVALFLGSFTLFLTFSVSAWLALAIAVLFISSSQFRSLSNKYSILIISLGLFLIPISIKYLANQYPHSYSLTRRAWLNQAAINMVIDRPLIGVGLNNFTATVETYSTNREAVRFLQPVHHLGLLWIAETGVVGIVILILIIRRLISHKSFIAWFIILLPVIALDHYLLTQQTGLLLLSLVWGVNATALETPLPPEKIGETEKGRQRG